METKEISVDVKLEQLEAMNQLLTDSVRQAGETIKHLKNIIITLIIAFTVVIVSGFSAFVWYESQFECVETEEITQTKEMNTEGDNAYINNIEGSQYNDNATHNESGDN